MKSGALVRVYAPSLGDTGELGLGIFLRRIIPSRDLSLDHSFWEKKRHSDPLSSSWHNEVLYCGTVHVLLEKQFPIATVED